MKQRKILYILGAGHSGSTVLDILLSQSDGIFGTGELINLHRNGWINNEYCACGSRANDCAFWSRAKKSWQSQSGLSDAKEFVDLQRKFERIRFLLLPKIFNNHADFHKYQVALQATVNSVFSESGVNCIVDSSKKHVRALYLSQLSDLDVYVIFLVRDSRGVAWSGAKKLQKDEKAGVQTERRGKSILVSTKDWLVVNLLCWLTVKRIGDRWMRVRYEDFVADPAAVLKSIQEFANVDLSGSVATLSQDRELLPSHTIAGNRLRMKGNLKISPDLSWRSNLTSRQAGLVWIFSGWLLKMFGYQRNY